MSIREQLEAAGGAPAPDADNIVSTPAEESAPAVETAANTPAASTESIAAATTAMQEAAYQPNYKFKYTGKNGDKWADAEGEFDPEIKALIKSKEDEEKWRKNYSKIHGLDYVADSRDKFKNELGQFKEQWSPIIDMAYKANQALTKGDMDAFFDIIGLPQDKIQSHVFSKLQLEDMKKQNPSQYQLLTQNQQLQKQTQTWEEKMSLVEQQNLQIQQDLLQTKLNYEYQKPEVSSFKTRFEADNGADSFYQEMQLRAEFIHKTQGRIAEPGEVIQEVMKRYAHYSSVPQQAAPTQQQAAAQVQPQVIPATQKPTIPVLGGGGQSPSSKSFKSLKDIKSYRESL
jgi:hypothetical protein